MILVDFQPKRWDGFTFSFSMPLHVRIVVDTILDAHAIRPKEAYLFQANTRM